MRYSKSNQIDSLVKQHISEGWIFVKGKKHGRLKSPFSKGCVTIPSTPSDWRTPLNFARDLRYIEKEVALDLVSPGYNQGSNHLPMYMSDERM